MDRYKGLILWGRKVSAEFREKVVLISRYLGIEVNWLMNCIAFESGETFSSRVTNKYSGAVGLIQFVADRDKSYKTIGNERVEISSLKIMTPVKQLDYVEKYLLPYKGKMKSLEDTYMAILFPKAIGKPLSYPLFEYNSIAYIQNKGLDVDKDGIIRKAEAAALVWAKFDRGLEFAYVTPEYLKDMAALAVPKKSGS